MKTILVVDDTPAFREPIAAALSYSGHDVHTALDGLDALEQMRRTPPDLLLLDLGMPRLDGIGVLNEMKRNNRLKHVPVILLTAMSEKDYVLRARELGVHDYLLKSSFSMDELLKRIQPYVGDGDAAPPAHDDSAVRPHTDTSPQAPAAQQTTTDEPDPTTALKARKPIVTRSWMLEQLDTCTEIKALSPTVANVLKMTASATCSIDHVTRAIRQDQAIALKMLKLANSVVYNRGEPVESVGRAVMRIGLSQIRQAVLNISVVDQFTSSDDETSLDNALFWEHAIATGLLAASLTRLRGARDADIETAFTAGLLHDVGRRVYVELLGEKYQEVVTVADELGLPLEQVENRLLLINHADAMDRILHTWKFPKELDDPIAFHQVSIDNIRHMARRMMKETATLALANRLAHAMLLGCSGNDTIYPIASFIDALSLDPAAIANLIDEIPHQTADMKLAMLSNSDGSEAQSMRHIMQKQLPDMPKPLVIGADNTLSVIAILCDALFMPSEEQPKVAIAHVRSDKQVPAMIASLQADEEHSLPLLLVYDSTNIAADSHALQGRTVITLRCPFRLARFVAALDQLVRRRRAAE